LAQRLVRKLCEHCKTDTQLSDVAKKDISLSPYATTKHAMGCKMCDFTGYKGRVAVGELFMVDDSVKEMIKQNFTDHQIRTQMKKKGMKTIADQLRELVEEGATSYEEALRVGIMDG
jgi:general secretion pathway protein E